MSDIGAVYKAFKTALTDGAASWGVKVYADQAPAGSARPYVVYSFAGGGDQSAIYDSDPNLVVDVICVADTLAAALTGEDEIRVRLDDHGELDRLRTVLGDNKFQIKTLTRETRIHFIENVSGATQIYHSGARYRAQLEMR